MDEGLYLSRPSGISLGVSTEYCKRLSGASEVDVMSLTTAPVEREFEAPASTKGKLSIVMFSGTADKFIPLGVLTQAATAMGMDVQVFVTGFALHAFTKEHHDLPFPAEFATMAPAMAKGMEANHVPAWDTMLRQAKEMGAKVYACSMMSDVMGLRRDDFDDLIDDIVGAAFFVQMAEDSETFFI